MEGNDDEDADAGADGADDRAADHRAHDLLTGVWVYYTVPRAIEPTVC